MRDACGRRLPAATKPSDEPANRTERSRARRAKESEQASTANELVPRTRLGEGIFCGALTGNNGETNKANKATLGRPNQMTRTKIVLPVIVMWAQH